MRALVLAAGLALAAGSTRSEVRPEEVGVGNQLVQIELFETGEIMWVGPNQYERTQVLSGPDIEIAAVLGDDAAVRMLGAPVVVAVQPGTQTCEDFGDPRAYYVVTLGEALATDGPLTTCAALTVSASGGAVVLQGQDEAWTWVPGQGFSALPQ
jgi:hypothetical protein